MKWPKQRRSYAVKTRFDKLAFTEMAKLTQMRGFERMELATIGKRGQTGHVFTRSHLTCHGMLRDTLYIQARRKSTEIFERSPQEIFTNVFAATNMSRGKYVYSTARVYSFKKIVYDDRWLFRATQLVYVHFHSRLTDITSRQPSFQISRYSFTTYDRRDTLGRGFKYFHEPVT